ncbi:MAG TPA: hypothetical protein VK211_19480 [Kamptonema sp.]|nr:hypothetical protein [Kamptonema sp.]
MTVQRQKRQLLRVAVTSSGILSAIAAAFLCGLNPIWKAINVRSESHELLLSVCDPNTDKDGITCTPP